MRLIMLKLAVWHFNRAHRLREASHREIDKAQAIIRRFYPNALREERVAIMAIPFSTEAQIPILIGQA